MDITSKALTFSDRLYRVMLYGYPKSYRREYGSHMAQLFRDECLARLLHRGSIGLGQLWLHILGDWSKTVFEQHIEEAFKMSARKWVVQLGMWAALIGGTLGLYLVTRGPNSYGNYGWHGWLAPLAALLLALGLAGAAAAFKEQLNALGWSGVILAVAGLLLMGIGFVIDALWFFIFLGPIIILPIGAVMLGISIYQTASLPTWWRFFPFVIVLIAVLGFGIELLEEFMGNSTPDRGLQVTEALLSLAWIGLGIGLWLNFGNQPDDPQLAI